MISRRAALADGHSRSPIKSPHVLGPSSGLQKRRWRFAGDLGRYPHAGGDGAVHRRVGGVLADKMHGPFGPAGDLAEAGLADADEGIAAADPGVLIPVLDRGVLPVLACRLPSVDQDRHGLYPWAHADDPYPRATAAP